MPIDIAVIIPCSKRKIPCPISVASSEELAVQAASLGRLAPYACAARDLYQGRQHRAMVQTIDTLRSDCPELAIDLRIVSAGYGLLREHDRVVPYDAALGATVGEYRASGARLGLHAALCQAIAPATFSLICLSAPYLIAAGAPFPCGNPIYLAASTAPLGPSTIVVSAGRLEARKLGKPDREARAAILALVCGYIAPRGLLGLEEVAAGNWSPGG